MQANKYKTRYDLAVEYANNLLGRLGFTSYKVDTHEQSPPNHPPNAQLPYTVEPPKSEVTAVTPGVKAATPSVPPPMANGDKKPIVLSLYPPFRAASTTEGGVRIKNIANTVSNMTPEEKEYIKAKYWINYDADAAGRNLLKYKLFSDKGGISSEEAAKLQRDIATAQSYYTKYGNDRYFFYDDFDIYANDHSKKGTGNNAYDGIFGGKVTYDMVKDQLMPQENKRYAELVKEYGEDSPEAKEYLHSKVGDYLFADAEYFTDHEKRIYLYLLNKYGEDRAYEYYDSIFPNLEVRRAHDNYATRMENRKNDPPFIKAIEDGFDIAYSGFEGTKQAIAGIGSYFSDKPKRMTYSEAMQRIMRENADGKLGEAMDIAYSVGSAAPAVAAGMANPYFGAAVSGLSSGGTAKSDALRAGYLPEEAHLYGTAVGLANGAGDYLLGNLPFVSKGAGKVVNKLTGYTDDALKLHPGVGSFVNKGIRAVAAGGKDFSNNLIVDGVVNPALRNSILGEDNKIDPFSKDSLYNAKIGVVSNAASNAIFGTGKKSPTDTVDINKIVLDYMNDNPHKQEYATLMNNYYQAGRNGKPFDSVYDSGITHTSIEAKQAAYEAGKQEGLTSVEKLPLASGENAGYNKDVDYDEFEQYRYGNYTDTEIHNFIKSGKVNITVHEGKQGKHIKGHNNYIPGRSYFAEGVDMQALIDKYAGTGKIIRDNSGKWIYKEVIVTDTIIGYDVSMYDGNEVPTNTFTIHYSKKGIHIVPGGKR